MLLQCKIVISAILMDKLKIKNNINMIARENISLHYNGLLQVLLVILHLD